MPSDSIIREVPTPNNHLGAKLNTPSSMADNEKRANRHTCSISIPQCQPMTIPTMSGIANLRRGFLLKNIYSENLGDLQEAELSRA